MIIVLPAITNSQTNQTLVKQPPTVPPQPPLQGNYSNLSVEGTAQQWLVGRRGEINGVILSSGAKSEVPASCPNAVTKSG